MSERRNIYFISDLHLGATYIKDPRHHEKMVTDWLMSIRDDAAHLYMLGDILDYWYEYRTVVPRGHIRFFGALAALADAGVKITWMIGNHDIWLFDYLRNEIGIEVVDGSMTCDLHGQRFYMSHGDGVGDLKPMFRMMRAIFRNKVCQCLYSAIHPRWTIPFAHRWSTSSRDYSAEIPRFKGESAEPLIAYSRKYLEKADPTIRYFVYGHRHVLVDYELSPGHNVIILGDWIHHFSYARFDGDRMELFTYKATD